MEKILNELSLLFKDVLEVDSVVLSESTTAEDVEDWDSLTHIMLITEIEKKYKIKFTSSEITGFKNAGELANSILSKANK